MVSRSVTVRNKLGLHARPATYFVQKATSYKCSIIIEKDERSLNAKSLLSVLSMGVIKGSVINLVFDGADELEALEGLCTFVSNGCGEVIVD
ncbi:MAG: HPr family phosphocarrier protein [Clostridia bacterium]|nr:HPr family phosphocarrier protein [Clostridia bacterium]